MSDFRAPLVLYFLSAPPVSSPSQPVLLPFEILKLVGFATGAALHLYLCWMLFRRYGIRRVERAFLGLVLSIGLWHLGNFAESIYKAIYDREVVSGGSVWLKTSNVIAYVAVALLPPLLAHTHFIVWKWFDDRAPRRLLGFLTPIGYVPLILLPWVVARLWSEPYEA